MTNEHSFCTYPDGVLVEDSIAILAGNDRVEHMVLGEECWRYVEMPNHVQGPFIFVCHERPESGIYRMSSRPLVMAQSPPAEQRMQIHRVAISMLDKFALQTRMPA